MCCEPKIAYDWKAAERAAQEVGVRWVGDHSMADYTTMGVGGPAALAFPRTISQVADFLSAMAGESIPWRVIGWGSNLLVTDARLPFVVVSLNDLEKSARFAGNELEVSANFYMPRLVRKAMDKSLAGLEELGGIPGSVGGMVRMNAGAYGKEMKEVVKEVITARSGTGVRHLSRSQLDFAYRHSAIGTDEIVLQACLLLHSDDPREIARRVKFDRQERKRSQPLHEKSAGCIFKNPTDQSGTIVPAGKLIEDLSLKGKTMGGAVVSEKHGNFIVNRHKATCSDIFALIDVVKAIVLKETGITLEEEVEIWK
ncbi:MAG: UDP-N-acetylmuramate dehydrogenase [Acidobacteria bacterium]|nr:UDP-N-acetylmuramate dehydrogenase [Acidobacteriota bacterium]MBI3657803.1 UDP-N-acetylmuramate dehydrogenase [Acidobacteriota bacterium]